VELPPGFTLDREQPVTTGSKTLPAGFTLDEPTSALPAGFTLDAPESPAPDPTQPLPDARDRSVFGEALDVPKQVLKGAVTGTRFLTDVFGADNPVSSALSGVEDYLDSLLSAQAKRDQQEISRIMQQAEDKGVGDQIKAGLQAMTVAPVDLISNAFGTSAPILAAGLAGRIAGLGAKGAMNLGTGVGFLQNTGITKDAIYSAVLGELTKAGVPEEQAKESAKEAQAYSGENLDVILLGGLLGGFAARYGLEPTVLTGSIGRALGKEVSEEVIDTAARRGVIAEASRTAIQEAIPEALQGGQEQFARNLALQREGFDVPLGRGVVTGATLEGAVGAPVGAIASIGQDFRLSKDAESAAQFLQNLVDEADTILPPVEAAPEEDVTIVDPDELTDEEIQAALKAWGEKEEVEFLKRMNTLTPEEQADELAAQGKTKADFDQTVSKLRSARNTLDRAKQQNLSDFEAKKLMQAPSGAVAPEVGYEDIQRTNQEAPLSTEGLQKIGELQGAKRTLKGTPKKAVSYFLKGTKTTDPNEGLFNLAYEVATNRDNTLADIEARRAAQPNIPETSRIQNAMKGKGKNKQELQPKRTKKQQADADAAAEYLRGELDSDTVARFDSLVESIRQRHQDAIIEQARATRLKQSPGTQKVEGAGRSAEAEARRRATAPGQVAESSAAATLRETAEIAEDLDLLEDTEATKVPEGRTEESMAAQIARNVQEARGAAPAVPEAAQIRNNAIAKVLEEMGLKSAPRRGSKRRAEYDRLLEAQVAKDTATAEKDFRSLTSEKIQQQIEEQGVPLPETKVKYKGENIDPEVVAIAERGNLKLTIDALLDTLPKELRPIVRVMRTMATATTIEIAPVEGPFPGKYDSGTNTITLDPERGLNTGVFFHELAHAALARRLNDPNSDEAKKFFEFFTEIKDQMGDAYGGTTLDEFVSELVSNSEFQNLLKDIKAPKSDTFWKNILDAILEFFGVRKGQSAYEAGIDFIGDILNIDPSVEPPPLSKVFFANGNPDEAIKEQLASLPNEDPSKAEKIIDDLPNNLKVGAFGFLRMDNIYDIYRKPLSAIKKIIDNTELRQGYQEQAIEDANKKYNAMLAVGAKFKAATRAMGKMALEARFAAVDILDPNFAKDNTLTEEQKKELKRLQGVFNGLPKEVQNVYRIMRKDFDKMYTDYKENYLANLTGKRLELAEKNFADNPPIAGYIPARRYGNYVLTYIDKDTNERTVATFETRKGREQAIRRLGLTLNPAAQRASDEDTTEEGSEAKEEQAKLQAGQYTTADSIRQATIKTLPPTGFVADLIENVREEGREKGLSDEEIKNLTDTVYETYLDLFPESSVIQNFRKAENIPGASEDVIRVYGDTMVRWARKMADTKYNTAIAEGFRDVRSQGARANDPNVYAAAKSIADREERTLNPTFGALSRMSTTGSYVLFMSGNISSGLVNLSSIPLLTFPILAGRFGGPKTSAALTKAGRVAILDIMKTEGVPRWGTADYEGGRYVKLYETLKDHGQLRHTLAREVLEGARQTTEQYNGLGSKVLNFLSIPIERTERYNRTTTAITAFDLALDSGMAPDKAAEYALRTVKDVNTSGMASTAPRWMQTDIGRVMFTFKSFIWQSAYVTAKAFVDSTRGSPDRSRKEAFRQLVYTFGMSYAIAGLFGMPFFGAISVLTNMINSLLDDEEEPYNLRRELMMILPEVVTKGPTNYYTNLEISNRASVANGILFREDPYEIEKYGYLQSMALQAFGPLGNYVMDMPYKLGLLAQGEYERAFEGLSPSWLRNGLKTMRYAQEGARTVDGRPIDEDLSTWNLFHQALGFAPADISSLYETRALAKQYEAQVMRARSNLLKRRYLAMTTGDIDLYNDTEQRIYAFMSRYPQLMTQDTLNRSFKSRSAQEQEYLAGVRFNKGFFSNLAPLFDRLEDVNYYGVV